jgi:hypothetical protein
MADSLPKSIVSRAGGRIGHRYQLIKLHLRHRQAVNSIVRVRPRSAQKVKTTNALKEPPPPAVFHSSILSKSGLKGKRIVGLHRKC